MASRVNPRASRKSLLVWIVCAAVSILLLATPPWFRRAISDGLEWSLFFPVRVVLGWEGRSLLTYLENQRLQTRLAADRLEVSRLRETARENDLLRRMLGMEARSELTLTPARVVGRNIDWSGEVLWTVAAGPAERGLAVVTPEGLLGRVASVTGSRVKIETIWHGLVGVSVIDRRSREEGILRWDPARPEEFLVDPVPIQGDFQVGDPVVTSGLGEVFPAGILVGFVSGDEENPRTQLKRIRVRSAVHRGRARQVFLVAEHPPQVDGSTLSRDFERTVTGPPPMPGGPYLDP